jgi:hypothetical protein
MLALGIGLVAGGMVTAAGAWILSGLLDWIPAAAAAYVVVGSALAVVLRDWGVLTVPLPQRHWQVPKSVLDQAPPRAALGFGFELGLGFRTYVSASAPYLLLIALMVLADPLYLYVLVGVGFGIGRFVTALGRYFGASGEVWGAVIAARGALIRSSTAVVAAASVTALAFA